MKLFVIRHGQTEENRTGIIQGQLPGHLDDLGKQQAAQVAELLSDVNFDQVWSSDLQRTIDTAQIIIKPHAGMKLQLSPLLREYDFGKYQGKSVGSWHWPKIDDPLDAHIPGGESARDVADRVAVFVNGLLSTPPNDTILIVTHGGPIRILRSLIDKIPLNQIIEKPVDHAKPFIFEVNSPLNAANLIW